MMGMPVIIPGTITLEESVGNIMESIAMEETSIAHILNAESEKIQAVLNTPGVTIQEIMDVNYSIQKTLLSVIALESSLLAKLNMFSCIICKM